MLENTNLFFDHFLPYSYLSCNFRWGEQFSWFWVTERQKPVLFGVVCNDMKQVLQVLLDLPSLSHHINLCMSSYIIITWLVGGLLSQQQQWYLTSKYFGHMRAGVPSTSLLAWRMVDPATTLPLVSHLRRHVKVGSGHMLAWCVWSLDSLRTVYP